MAARLKSDNLFLLGYAAIGIGYLLKLGEPVGGGLAGFRRGRGRSVFGGLGYADGRSREATYGKLPALPYTTSGRLVQSKDGIRTVTQHPAGTIKQRLARIVGQIKKDSLEPAVVTEARRIVSTKCGVEGNQKWCLGVKDTKAEIAAVFYALTDPNSKIAMRYTRDHATVDMFSSSESLRRLPVGDCDDVTIRGGALLRAIGYSVKCRIVAPAGHPNEWSHIYLMVGTQPGNDKGPWVAVDCTEAQNGPFWEVPKRQISTVMDFPV